MNIVVTGGAGFIGSHIADELVSEGHEVTIIDNLCTGKQENINKKAKFVKKDIRQDIVSNLKGTEVVFHFAADPEVKSSADNPTKSFDTNLVGTLNILECCRKVDVKNIILASTSTVYGDAKEIPTTEEYVCMPISNYGASKLASEAYLSSYSGSYGIKGTSLRYANIFGERSNHGVMFDFYTKLKQNPNELEILGDGKQDKSYLHVSDCVAGSLFAWKKQKKLYDAFNIGSKDKITVNHLTKLVCKSMNTDPLLKYTGTKRGWTGDVPIMLLDISKLEKLGWKTKVSFEEGVRRYIEWLKK